jgi:hypothetical protein
VNIQIKRFLTVFLIASGIFLVTAASVYISNRILSASERPVLFFALISGGIAAALSLPIFFRLAFKPAGLENYSAFTVEEMDLNEDELTEAVRNWVFAKHQLRMGDDVRFLEDDDGNVTCRVTVRKD